MQSPSLNEEIYPNKLHLAYFAWSKICFKAFMNMQKGKLKFCQAQRAIYSKLYK